MSDARLERKLLAAVDRLGRALRAARQAVATKHRLSLLGIQLVEALADGRDRRVGELAAELDITQATASDAVATLVDRGLLDRTPDPTDRRASRLTLTPSGARLARSVAAELAPLLGGGVDREGAGDSAGALPSRADRAIALRVLLAEIARLQAAGVITVNRSCLTCLHYEPPTGSGPDGSGPARCLLLEMPLHDEDLRVDCPEHAPAALTP